MFEKPKQSDKIVSNHLDKLFSSIRLQMQFLVKCLLGRRWKDLLDSLAKDNNTGSQKKATGGGTASLGAGMETEDESDCDDGKSFLLKIYPFFFRFRLHPKTSGTAFFDVITIFLQRMSATNIPGNLDLQTSTIL